MSKKAKTALPNIIKRKENYVSFLVLFSEKELTAKKKELSDVLSEKFISEQAIIEAKHSIKQCESKALRISNAIKEGGEDERETCDVEIYVKEKIKRYYFKGKLVKEEEANDDDLQTEIDDEQDEDDN